MIQNSKAGQSHGEQDIFRNEDVNVNASANANDNGNSGTELEWEEGQDGYDEKFVHPRYPDGNQPFDYKGNHQEEQPATCRQGQDFYGNNLAMLYEVAEQMASDNRDHLYHKHHPEVIFQKILSVCTNNNISLNAILRHFFVKDVQNPGATLYKGKLGQTFMLKDSKPFMKVDKYLIYKSDFTEENLIANNFVQSGLSQDEKMMIYMQSNEEVRWIVKELRVNWDWEKNITLKNTPEVKRLAKQLLLSYPDSAKRMRNILREKEVIITNPQYITIALAKLICGHLQNEPIIPQTISNPKKCHVEKMFLNTIAMSHGVAGSLVYFCKRCSIPKSHFYVKNSVNHLIMCDIQNTVPYTDKHMQQKVAFLYAIMNQFKIQNLSSKNDEATVL